ncbi:MAG TPA: APC family permease [Candidatus Acidoferrum sp.]|nr:APC family permease [Candidatus Acidoferrum sp.]
MDKGSSAVSGPQLKRSLTLWDLILYGAIVLQPVAPMSVFGALSDRGRGHVVTAILIAMVAMLFTAMSYGRMARAYPSAGSAFTYVAQEIHPAIGYVTGWSFVMDYIVNPLICTIWCAVQAHEFAPGIPVWGWKIFFAVAFTLLNLQGIKTSARVNAGLTIGMSAVVIVVFVAAIRYILGHPHSDPRFFTRPFYDPETFTWGNLFGCTSIAVLSYIGFDAISTLSEEAENPRRNILLATVLTCVVIGFLSAAQVYVAQLVWPASEPFPNPDTAYVWVAARTWAPLFKILGLTLIVANFGSGMGAHIGAARLLYGMGRSSALPKSFFGAIDPKHHVPRNNVLVVGAIALILSQLRSADGSFLLTYERGVELLNYGALIAFMGVNAAALARYFLRVEHKSVGEMLRNAVSNLIPPLLGFVICFFLWLNLSRSAKIAGSIWMLAGIAFGVWKTRGFREQLSFEVPPE